MPDVKEYIEHLQQVANARGGKVIVIILLLIGALLVATRLAIWSGTLDPLQGAWRTAYTFGIYSFVFALAGGIAVILWPKQRTESVLDSANKEDTKNRNFLENNAIRLWIRRVVLAWMLILMAVMYVVGWIFVWQGAISPIIQQISTTQVDWSDSRYLTNFVSGFMIVTLWLIMPGVLYLEFGDMRRKSKQAKDTKAKREE